jgi:hypothetical protein
VAILSYLPLIRVKQQLDEIRISDAKTANMICQLIPDRCPFERRIYLFGYLICSIPPLCKLNPFYKQLMSLRSKAVTYLAEIEAE